MDRANRKSNAVRLVFHCVKASTWGRLTVIGAFVTFISSTKGKVGGPHHRSLPCHLSPMGEIQMLLNSISLIHHSLRIKKMSCNWAFHNSTTADPLQKNINNYYRDEERLKATEISKSSVSLSWRACFDHSYANQYCFRYEGEKRIYECVEVKPIATGEKRSLFEKHV